MDVNDLDKPLFTVILPVDMLCRDWDKPVWSVWLNSVDGFYGEKHSKAMMYPYSNHHEFAWRVDFYDLDLYTEFCLRWL